MQRVCKLKLIAQSIMQMTVLGNSPWLHLMSCVQDKEDGKGSAAKPGKPLKAGSKKAAGGAEDAKAGKAADRQRQAQLEMLMMDDNALQDMSRIGSAAYLATCSKLVS